VSMFNSVTELKEAARTQRYQPGAGLLSTLLYYLGEVNKIIPDKEILYVYPIKLIGDSNKIWDETDFKLVIFTKKNVIIVTDDNLQNINIEFYNKADINNITLNIGKVGRANPNKYDATIIFKNGSQLILSREDAGRESQDFYCSGIAEILHFLCSSD
jgi:hypothetical protein